MDTVLWIYGEEPEAISLKGRIGKLSPYLGRADMSRRCQDAIREFATIKADCIAVQAMRNRGLDPERHRKLRSDFIPSILVSLHDLQEDRRGRKSRAWAQRNAAAERLKILIERFFCEFSSLQRNQPFEKFSFANISFGAQLELKSCDIFSGNPNCHVCIANLLSHAHPRDGMGAPDLFSRFACLSAELNVR